MNTACAMDADKAAVRIEAGRIISEHLLPSLGDGAVSELEEACWRRASSLLSDPIDIEKVYIQACRDALSNLCDPSDTWSNGNAWLRGAVMDGTVSISDIPGMGAADLRPGVHRPAPTRCCDSAQSDEMRANNLFECPRCSARKCTHHELQTRSADEATTVFVTCVVCGHKWTE